MDNVRIEDVLRLQDLGWNGWMRIEPLWVSRHEPRRELPGGWTSRRGLLLLLMVPDDPESGCFYIYDRGRGQFYSLSLPVEGRYGGFREDEFEVLAQTFDLAGLARDPQPLRA